MAPRLCRPATCSSSFSSRSPSLHPLHQSWPAMKRFASSSLSALLLAMVTSSFSSFRLLGFSRRSFRLNRRIHPDPADLLFTSSSASSFSLIRNFLSAVSSSTSLSPSVNFAVNLSMSLALRLVLRVGISHCLEVELRSSSRLEHSPVCIYGLIKFIGWFIDEGMFSVVVIGTKPEMIYSPRLSGVLLHVVFPYHIRYISILPRIEVDTSVDLGCFVAFTFVRSLTVLCSYAVMPLEYQC